MHAIYGNANQDQFVAGFMNTFMHETLLQAES